MQKIYEYKGDSRIQGLVTTRKANFSKCMDISCPNLNECTAIKVEQINCIYEKPLVQISKSKFDLRTETKNKIKGFFERLLLNLKKPNTFHNATNQVFLNNLAKHLANESQPDLSAQYVAFSSSYDIPTKNSVLELELGRVAQSSISRTNAAVTVEGSFGLTDANTLSTTVGTYIDSTQFTVAAISGSGLKSLEVGDRIQVKVSSTRWFPTKITAISGLQLTVDPPLDTALSGGEEVEQMISRVQLIAGSATLTLNSGDPVSIAPYIDTKASTETLDVTFTITFV